MDFLCKSIQRRILTQRARIRPSFVLCFLSSTVIIAVDVVVEDNNTLIGVH